MSISWDVLYLNGTSLSPLKIERCRDANLVITGGTAWWHPAVPPVTTKLSLWQLDFLRPHEFLCIQFLQVFTARNTAIYVQMTLVSLTIIFAVSMHTYAVYDIIHDTLVVAVVADILVHTYHIEAVNKMDDILQTTFSNDFFFKCFIFDYIIFACQCGHLTVVLWYDYLFQLVPDMINVAGTDRVCWPRQPVVCI